MGRVDAKIYWRRDGSVDLSFRYHADLVDDLKREIPAWCRTYDPDTKTWTVFEDCANEAVELLYSYFANPIVGHESPPKANTPPTSGDHAALFVLPTAPRGVIDAAYRALAKLHHPDLLPEEERPEATVRMQAINAAYQRLTGR